MEPIVKLDRINVYTCNKCSRATTNQDDLNGHICYIEGVLMRVTEKERSKLFKQESEKLWKAYQCCDCFEIFPHESDLFLHEDWHLQNIDCESINENPEFDDDHLENPYKCKVCGISYAVQKALEKHSVVHKTYPHVCSCGVGYYNIDDLHNHQNLVHPTKTTKKYADITTRNQNRKESKPAKRRSKTELKVAAKENKSFSTSGTLSWHLKRHSGEKNFECGYCKKIFYSQHILNRHKIIHTQLKPFECKYCGKCFTAPKSVERHIRIHTGEKPYSCSYCPMKFSTTGALLYHRYRHEGIKKYKCNLCDKAFYASSPMKVHMLTHTKEKKFQCNECFKAFNRKERLIKHIQAMHEQEKKYECKECCLKFFSKNSLMNHVTRVHLKKKNYKCTECGKWFLHKKELEAHVRTHMPWLFYECDYCFKRYSTKWTLLSHILEKHINIKCEVCLKCFSSNSELEIHKKCFCKGPKVIKKDLSLSQLKKCVYECHDCLTKFSSKSGLLQHCIQTHGSGYDKYICDYCNKEFKLRNLIVKHVRKTHPMWRKCCNVCKKTFYTKTELAKHKKGCIKQEFICKFCDKIFTSKAGFTCHLRTHLNLKNYECLYCGNKYKKRSDLRYHVRSRHSADEIY